MKFVTFSGPPSSGKTSVILKVIDSLKGIESKFGVEEGLDLLISESAGLCNRCSPHIKDVLAVCVIDSLSGVNTPKKIGPMLKFADVIVITKGDIVSQAEREVFKFMVKEVNPRAKTLYVNGLTGQEPMN